MSQDKIISEFIAIYKSTDSAESKPNRYRIVLEKACKFLIDVPLDEKIAMSKILNILANSPGTFNLQIISRVRKLYNYFSTWSHATDLIFDVKLFHEHENLLKEFIETVFEEKIDLEHEDFNSYLTDDGRSIKIMEKSKALKDKDAFINLLELWYSKNKMRPGCVINEAKANYEACVYVTIDNIDYKLNSDTKLEGVKTFLENRDNDLVLIANRDGNKNKLVNTKNGTPIRGFYMYKLFY